MQEKIDIGCLFGTHGGRKVYPMCGVVGTLNASEYKHIKMVFLWKDSYAVKGETNLVRKLDMAMKII